MKTKQSLTPDVLTREDIFSRISAELDRAYQKHGREKWGRHEFYAIIKEEVDEVWDAIKKDEPSDRVTKEAIQVAAMVFRYLETGDRYRTVEEFSPPTSSRGRSWMWRRREALLKTAGLWRDEE